MGKLEAFHKPLAPNGTTAYIGLCTVMQAFPLAALLFVVGYSSNSTDDKTRSVSICEHITDSFYNQRINDMPLDKIIEIFIIVLVVAAIWHRYVTDNSFVAWEVDWADTLIPFGFGAVQTCLALSIVSKNTSYFSFWIVAVTTLGICAYRQLIPKLERPHSKKLFEEHFDGTGLADIIYNEVHEHFTSSKIFLKRVAIFASIVFLIAFISNKEEIKISAVTVVSIPVIWIMLKDDLPGKVAKHYWA